MNTPPIPQPTSSSSDQPILKPTFYNLVVMHDFDHSTLQLVATMAGVAEDTISAMFTTTPIHRADAQKILTAFSKYTQESYTLDNVRVALYPTFSDIVTTHKLDTTILSTHSGVPITTIDIMICDEPVPIQEARLVLQMAARLSGADYTFANVDVPIADEEVPRG